MTANTSTSTFLFQSNTDNALYGFTANTFVPISNVVLGNTSAALLLLTPLTFATLPNAPANGTLVTISDANVATWGTAVTIGGGTTNALIRWNGTAWTVVGV